MQRKRGELVPIGDAFGNLPGPFQAIRDDSPQARRGFTVADQVNQLVGASEADSSPRRFGVRSRADPVGPVGRSGRTSGGSRGDRTRLRNQMRLFNAHVQLVYEDKLGEANVSSSVAGGLQKRTVAHDPVLDVFSRA